LLKINIGNKTPVRNLKLLELEPKLNDESEFNMYFLQQCACGLATWARPSEQDLWI